ncbi:transcriptional regulator with XRE-family HTH domain [Sporomusaceae bacterium BoRhaA]|uniref:helix-turn-helix domain-containing protein n=1 Tax=Pelorhabdus rhamnosifermentans TaxID=2772457 RepID=UPI001C060A7F|nr:helix-turn-helix transcriptional regulator [Pelorhabdus rhamnosifermentans]MBU2702618.1 transcriptional regulator with XRE-family HTH domain [Pelorhabdus rhamnosifermentans]
MISREKFSERLKALRTAKNLSHAALGNKLGVSKALIGHWETGFRLPSLEVANALADYFDVSIDYLVGKSDKPERK